MSLDTAPSTTPRMASLVSRMELVGEYRASLLRLQGAWDLLALLGPMSGIGAEIGHTRTSFHRLTDTLLDNLARQLLQQRLQGLRGQAQVAIDILVRNLFERTADVGFLATDGPLREFTEAAGEGRASDADRAAIRSRFAAYVAKYSVYDDIVVLAPDGRVLARLDDRVTVDRACDPLLAAARRQGVPYVESFGATDVLGGRRGLLYAASIAGPGGQPAGVLCLSFRLLDEMRGVAQRLLGGGDESGDDTVLLLLDARGEVITSSDPWQVPVGATLPTHGAERSVVRFGGREYLRVAAVSAGYQGYAGPGWQAQALAPLEFAFRHDGVDQTGSDARGDHRADDHAALARRLDTRDIFDAELRGIPAQAQHIQRELARSVWNGTLGRGADEAAGTHAQAFAATFLQEVSRTGTQIRAVFEAAIERLQTGAINALLDQARFHASLAIDIMDRNLYERANDCRWWALTPLLRQALAEPGDASSRAAGEVLRHINGLYTVYTLLVLFDARGTVVAVSDPAREHLIGQAIDPALTRATLALRDPRQYHVGPHAVSALHDHAPTYVYSAAVQPASGAGSALGGVAIVFDGVPQFAAMLADALPRQPDGRPTPGAIGLFVSRSGIVIASTDARFPPGRAVPFATTLFDLAPGAARGQVLEIDGVFHAAGIRQSGGYREYLAERVAGEHDVAALVLTPLGRELPRQAAEPAPFEPRQAVAVAVAGAGRGGIGAPREIAAFTVGDQWYGLPADEVVEVLSDARVIARPGAAPDRGGMVRHRDRVVAVLDLAAHLGLDASAVAGGPLLLCRTPRGREFAMRVGALGQVLGIDAGQLAEATGHGGPSRPRLLSGHCGGVAAMLTVLSAATLWPVPAADAPARSVLDPRRGTPVAVASAT